MRYLFVLLLFSMFGYSQSNEALINQALQQAEAQNITTPAEVAKALEASGMTESQARQLAAQRGLSYDQLLSDFFSDENSENPELEENSESEDGIEDEDSEEQDEKEEEQEERGENKPAGARFFGYDIFNNNPYLDKEYLLGNIDEGYLIAPGDRLRIITYGDNSFEQNVEVDRNGNINIRGYGLFFASGNS